MKKRFGMYAAAWAVLLALFNVISFVSVGWACCEKYSASFWIGYGLITAAFVGQLICAYVALKEENNQKLFYKLSLIKASYCGLIAMFVAGGLCMVISPLPYWTGAILCVAVLAVNVVAVIKAGAAAEEVERVDRKMKVQTSFVKALTVDAEALLASAKSETVEAECKKVYEAIRYSDPMSSEQLSSVEGKIATQFASLSEAVAVDNVDTVTAAAVELQILLKERNNKCKLLK